MVTQTALARNLQFTTALFHRRVLCDARLSRSSKLLAVALASISDNGVARVRTPDLCRMSSISAPTLIRARRPLERYGYVRVQYRPNGEIESYVLAGGEVAR